MSMQDSERLIQEALDDGECERYRAAIRKFDEALVIRRRICAETDPKLMEAFFHCGIAQLNLYNYYIKLKKLFYNPEIRSFLPHGILDYDDFLDGALVALHSSKGILERQEPSLNTVDAAIIYTVLAQAQFNRALYEAANSNADRALAILYELQGHHDAKIADIRLKKAACFYQLKKHTDAKAQLTIAKEICSVRLAELTAEGERLQREHLSWIARNCDDLLHYVNDDCKSGCEFCVNRIL